MYYEKIIPSPSHLFTSPIIFKLQRKKFGSIKKITNKNQQNRFINSEKKSNVLPSFIDAIIQREKNCRKFVVLIKKDCIFIQKQKKKSTEKKRNEF